MTYNRNNPFADAFFGIVYGIRDAVRHIGWDKPIRPDHVVYATYPRSFGTTTAKALVSFLGVYIIGSIPPTAILYHAHVLTGAPILVVPTVLDTISVVFSHLMPQMPAIPGVTLATPSVTNAPAPWLSIYFTETIPGAVAALLAAIGVAGQPTKLPRRFLGAGPHTDFASLNDIRKGGLIEHSKHGIYVGSIDQPPLFGIIPRPRLDLVDANEAHFEEVASSRSGKDVGSITPTLAKTYGYSALINDNKTEQFKLTSGVRRGVFRNDVHRLCYQARPLGEQFTAPNGKVVQEEVGTSFHNILNEVPWAEDGERAMVNQINTILIAEDQSLYTGENAHFYNMARVLANLLVVKNRYDPAEVLKNLSRVAMMFGDPKEEEAQAQKKDIQDADGAQTDSMHEMIEHFLGWKANGLNATPSWMRRTEEYQRDLTARQLALLHKQFASQHISEAQYATQRRMMEAELQKTLKHIQESYLHPDIETNARMIMRTQGEEASSIYSTLSARMTPFLDPRVISNTRTSDFSLLGLVNSERPVSLYVCNAPEYGDIFRPLYNMFFEILFRVLAPEVAENAETKRPERPHIWPLLCVWNEPMTIGKIESLDKLLPFSAAYGVRHAFYFQLANQRTAIYGDNQQITGNSFTSVYHTPNDPVEAKTLAESLGEHLVVTHPRSSQGGFSQTTRSEQTVNVPLMTASDIMRMPNDIIVRKRRLSNGEEVNITDKNGAAVIKEPGRQIVRMRGGGFAYTRKSPYFGTDHSAVYANIRRFRWIPIQHNTSVSRDAAEMDAYKDAPPIGPATTTGEAPRTRNLPSITMLPIEPKPRGDGHIDTHDFDDYLGDGETRAS